MSDAMTHVKSGDWSYCPACGGGIDTGYECGKCGRDWLEWQQTRATQRQEIERLTAERELLKEAVDHKLKEGDYVLKFAGMAMERDSQDRLIAVLQQQLTKAEQARDLAQFALMQHDPENSDAIREDLEQQVGWLTTELTTERECSKALGEACGDAAKKIESLQHRLALAEQQRERLREALQYIAKHFSDCSLCSVFIETAQQALSELSTDTRQKQDENT